MTPGYRHSLFDQPDIVTFGGSSGQRALQKRCDYYSKSGDDWSFPLTTLASVKVGSSGSGARLVSSLHQVIVNGGEASFKYDGDSTGRIVQEVDKKGYKIQPQETTKYWLAT